MSLYSTDKTMPLQHKSSAEEKEKKSIRMCMRFKLINCGKNFSSEQKKWFVEERKMEIEK